MEYRADQTIAFLLLLASIASLLLWVAVRRPTTVEHAIMVSFSDPKAKPDLSDSKVEMQKGGRKDQWFHWTLSAGAFAGFYLYLSR
jgi:hypothetical protein